MDLDRPLTRRNLLRLGAGAGAAVTLGRTALPAWARPVAFPAGIRQPGSRPFPGRPEGEHSIPELEHIVHIARKQAYLSKSMVFFSRTQQVFQLWHVVHRPFSYAFAILAILHIGIALFMGYRL